MVRANGLDMHWSEISDRHFEQLKLSNLGVHFLGAKWTNIHAQGAKLER